MSLYDTKYGYINWLHILNIHIYVNTHLYIYIWYIYTYTYINNIYTSMLLNVLICLYRLNLNPDSRSFSQWNPVDAIYIYTYIYVYIYSYIYLYMHTYIRIFLYTYIHNYIYLYVYDYIQIEFEFRLKIFWTMESSRCHIYTYLYVYNSICAYWCTNIFLCIYICN
jgi:hypothetical protein